AYDEAGTISAGKRLWREVNRPNALIKVPATREGVKAFETLIAAGINVNVTLMFSLHHVLQVAQAYLRGVRACVERGGNARRVKAVASVFLSRVDSVVDKQLEACGSAEALALRGKAAVSMAKVAYQRYKDLFHGLPFAEFKATGVRPQYLLWASTGTKNPAYSDVLYVEELVGPETINTMPSATLAAFRDHGKASLTLEQGVQDARQCLIALKDVGVDMHAVGEQLQVEGVQLFEQAFAKLLDKVAETSSIGVTAVG
ncbi:MAG: transaldolase family protein, partial [Burkholderiales bacterium]